MLDLPLRIYVRLTFGDGGGATAVVRRRMIRDDRGEGVISAAIAVLIMAFLGVVVWVGFKATLDDTQDKVDQQIQEIGQ